MFSVKRNRNGFAAFEKIHAVQMSQKEVKYLETEYLFFQSRVLKQISTQRLENLLPPLNWCMRNLMLKKKLCGLNRVVISDSEKI